MVHAQLVTSRYRVAQVLAGGHVVQHPSGGQFFAPTVLTNITSDMRIWRYVFLHAFIQSLIHSFVFVYECIRSSLGVSFIQA